MSFDDDNGSLPQSFYFRKQSGDFLDLPNASVFVLKAFQIYVVYTKNARMDEPSEVCIADVETDSWMTI